MKAYYLKLWPCLFIISIILSFPLKAAAHLAGQPPFLRINGIFANLYPVPLTSLEDFNLPQDAPPANYYINQEINFELALKNLPPAPPDVVARTKFTWDFGDGGKGEGVSQTHIYKTIGSFFLDIYADDGTTPTPQLIEKVLLNILPNKDYKLPQAKIVIDNAQSKDPVTDILKFNFNHPLNLNGANSMTGSAKIVSYFWDQGDQTTSTDVQATHQYSTDLTQIFPVLRIKDRNGFISDAYVEVENSPQETAANVSNAAVAKPSSFSPHDSTKLLYLIFGPAGLFFLICITVGVILKKLPK